MERQYIAETLSNSTEQVLETMFFSEVLPDSEQTGLQPEPVMAAEVKFDGEIFGTFRLSITNDSAKRIALNFLGLDEESEMQKSRVADVICELANMVCGTLLSRLHADHLFRLSKPQLAPTTEGILSSEMVGKTFFLEDGSLTATVMIQKA